MKSVPPHALGVALGTVTPDGRVSVKPTPVSEVPALGLVIVNVSVEVRLSAIVDGLNDEVVVGGDAASAGAEWTANSKAAVTAHRRKPIPRAPTDNRPRSASPAHNHTCSVAVHLPSIMAGSRSEALSIAWG